MVKAGVQQMALPDIYKMFKTASDEDKIKLMNTYSNLGERLGERDKDIDYRRKRGDKDALTEKMYTEGIGDVVGSAWDYTKQGAETAWDYAKKGAKKGAESLRDLVMRDTAVNDLVRGDEYIEEEQLPTNNTPPRVELGGAEEALPSQEHMLLGFGPDSIMERNLRDRLNGLNLEQYPYADNPDTEQKYPAFEPENVFESTMARNLRDRLNGLNLKQYPYDDDWESTNSSTGADVEKEEETLSPQEQRFLGVDAEKEEVVESPMARRMRERLEVLTAQQEQYADNPDARWSDLYNIDPERATFDYGREKDRLDFLRKAASGTQESPEKIIRMLQTEINRTTRNRDKAIEDYGANSVQAQRYNNLLKELETEMNSDSPSVRNAYARSGEQPPPEVSGLDGAEDIKNMIRDAKFSDLGLLVGRDDIASAIEDWRVEKGVSVQDPTYKSLMKTLEDKEKSKDKQYTRTDAEQKQFTDLDKKYKKMYTYASKTPTQTWQKAQLLNIVLRDETGAAIAADEARDLALAMLPDDAMRNDFITQWDTAISTAISNMDTVTDAVKIVAASSGNLPWSEIAGLGPLLEKIKSKMDGRKLQEYALSAIPDEYLAKKGKVTKIPQYSTETTGRKIGDTWEDDHYYYRIDENGQLNFKLKG